MESQYKGSFNATAFYNSHSVAVSLILILLRLLYFSFCCFVTGDDGLFKLDHERSAL
jgi:hypothetical protein